MCSTQMKRTVQIVKCISMSEPHEQSLTVFVTDNHAKIFGGRLRKILICFENSREK